MTASEFVQDLLHNDTDIISLEMKVNELVELLQEFALLKCTEQREICAEYAVLPDQDKLILNAENPEM